MGNNPDAETFFLHARHREADAVHRHRAFEDNVTHHFRRRGDVEHVVLPHAFPADDFAHAVNVAGHEMPAELAVRAQRPLQVHQRTGFGKLQVGAPPRFLEQIESDELEFPARGHLYRRQTTAVHRQTAAQLQTATGRAGAHGQFNGFRRRLDALDGPGFFNNACEHFSWSSSFSLFSFVMVVKKTS